MAGLRCIRRHPESITWRRRIPCCQFTATYDHDNDNKGLNRIRRSESRQGYGADMNLLRERHTTNHLLPLLPSLPRYVILPGPPQSYSDRSRASIKYSRLIPCAVTHRTTIGVMPTSLPPCPRLQCSSRCCSIPLVGHKPGPLYPRTYQALPFIVAPKINEKKQQNPKTFLAAGATGKGGEEEGGEGAAAAGTRSGVGLGRRRRRPGDPSSSRLRSADAVWPEHFVEAVAAQVAVDAARSDGRLAAAPAVVSVFTLVIIKIMHRKAFLYDFGTMRPRMHHDNNHDRNMKQHWNDRLGKDLLSYKGSIR
ncbi:hypothetical protein MUK42_04256 [Musa troglodytarum]|uniref:Uncharacterized protein n=1 Tax=Musa troglodytarum TaxID=320322 RepID=A0A9E7GB06_9LILI|nr:hypothetical protein MUK42_04256 [Musa troglodytarum]